MPGGKMPGGVPIGGRFWLLPPFWFWLLFGRLLESLTCGATQEALVVPLPVLPGGGMPGMPVVPGGR
ncbi:hypothetical protein BBK82_20620 [Lentzea guizhouensis]|uniref:Uncharacterized protein n=1 Tax=Lentzea guizhouensis TaxID=1586287 RepID=A0A1B2HK48_9PSEU|nr:hypothetical protein BBK82_20620 [Lentzea guizhouensis]